MQEININNTTLINTLNGIMSNIKALGVNGVPIMGKHLPRNKHIYGTSDKYLKIAQLNGIDNPQIHKGMDISQWVDIPHKWELILKKVDNLFPCGEQALFTYYPINGFIGWHNNSNIPGYTVLFNYSKEGNGFYRYVDPSTKEIVTIKDKPGWSCKTGYYGQGKTSVFHCASTEEPRWSIAFRFEDKQEWLNIKEYITGIKPGAEDLLDSWGI
jgi:hypothetical protein